MTWDDYRAIAKALALAYPTANYATIGDDALVRLIVALPGFSGPPMPPPGIDLAAIQFAWIAEVEGPDDGSPYESIA